MKANRKEFSGRKVIAAHRCGLKVKSKSFAAGDGSASVTTLQGYPIVFSKPGVAGTTSDDRGGYVVAVPSDAVIKFTTPTLALFHHQFNSPLGTTANGTLRVGEPDATGIPVEIDLNTATTIGSDVAAWVARGDVAGMSFSMANGFEDYDITEGDDANNLDTVTVTRFTVDEVTITPIPAMTATTIEPAEATPAAKTTPTIPQIYSNAIEAKLKMQRLVIDMLAVR